MEHQEDFLEVMASHYLGRGLRDGGDGICVPGGRDSGPLDWSVTSACRGKDAQGPSLSTVPGCLQPPVWSVGYCHSV